MHAISSRRRSLSQRGVSLLVACTSLVFLVPLIGLVIDVGVLYVVRARLQSSVDGASLAAARSLNLGQTTEAQAGNAKQNAVNWFYSNFPSGNWATSGTVMNPDTVEVFDDPQNPQLRNVKITATTVAPTYFMKWFGSNAVTVKAIGNASRRDVVAMMILDRSGSMCKPSTASSCSKSNTTTACAAMITAAKTFVSNFAPQRDRIGLVTFSDGAIVHHGPVLDFDSKLPPIIDALNCNGMTAMPGAISLAYNELYKLALPGALNLIVLETDGVPNTVAYNFWNGTSFAVNSGSGCKDVDGKTKAASGWANASKAALWMPNKITMGPGGYMADIDAGAIGGLYKTDPGVSKDIQVMYNPIQDTYSTNPNRKKSLGAGCRWTSTFPSDENDLDWFPTTDIFGNTSTPSNPYKTGLTSSGGKVTLTHTNVTADWTNADVAAFNMTDNAAYRARTNTTLPAMIYTIGLDGNGPFDGVLLQRLANDPTGCSSLPGCISYANQPQGKYVYAPSTAQLGDAFRAVAAQVLRLSE